MAQEQLNLGSTPGEEPCEQLGPNYNHTKARMECQIYKDQLYRLFHDDFESRTNNSTVYMVVRGFDHDFGRYLEVVVSYDDKQSDDVALAFKIENNLPAHWDDESRAKLEMLGILATA